MAQIVKVIVEPLELGEQRAQHQCPRWGHPAGRALHRLAEREGMSEAADPRNPFRQHRAAGERAPLEALLHAAMLEKELGLEVEDVLADIEKDQLHQLHHIRPHRPEGQPLDIGAGDFRQEAVVRGLERHQRIGRISRVERRQDGSRALMKNQPVRFGMAAKFNPEQVGDLAFVPAHERADGGDTWHRPTGGASPNEKVTLWRGRDIAQLDAAGIGVPGIGHLHPAAIPNQPAHRGGQILGLDQRGLGARDGALSEGCHRTAGESECAIDVR